MYSLNLIIQVRRPSVSSVLIEFTQLGLLICEMIFLVQKLVPVLSSSLVLEQCFTVCKALHKPFLCGEL